MHHRLHNSAPTSVTDAGTDSDIFRPTTPPLDQRIERAAAILGGAPRVARQAIERRVALTAVVLTACAPECDKQFSVTGRGWLLARSLDLRRQATDAETPPVGLLLTVHGLLVAGTRLESGIDLGRDGVESFRLLEVLDCQNLADVLEPGTRHEPTARTQIASEIGEHLATFARTYELNDRQSATSDPELATRRP